MDRVNAIQRLENPYLHHPLRVSMQMMYGLFMWRRGFLSFRSTCNAVLSITPTAALIIR